MLEHKASLNMGNWQKKPLHPTFLQMNKTVYQQEEKQKKVSKLMTTEQHTVNKNWVKGEIQKEI